jgi:hypothetical protein
MPEVDHAGASASTVGPLRRTLAALGVARARRDSRLVALVAGLGYLALYLVTVGDLAVLGGTADGFTVRTVDDLSRAFASVGFFRFDAVAVVAVGPLTYLFSPLNLLVATVLSALVGANAALSYLGLVQPRACGLEASTGVLAGVPALLSGAACCGPTVLLVVGVQASAALVAGFHLLVPVAVAMLVGSLLAIGRQVDPELL